MSIDAAGRIGTLMTAADGLQNPTSVAVRGRPSTCSAPRTPPASTPIWRSPPCSTADPSPSGDRAGC
ncbi:hypothetical protein NKG94_04600 [Micromonospora sp. M12]